MWPPDYLRFNLFVSLLSLFYISVDKIFDYSASSVIVIFTVATMFGARAADVLDVCR